MNTSENPRQWVEPTGDRLINVETNAREIHDADDHKGTLEACRRCERAWGRPF
jgi:hypothetical protein